MLLRKLNTQLQKNKTAFIFIPYTKIHKYTKWIKDLNVKTRNYKTPEKKYREKFPKIVLQNDFLHMTPKAIERKQKQSSELHKMFCFGVFFRNFIFNLGLKIHLLENNSIAPLMCLLLLLLLSRFSHV